MCCVRSAGFDQSVVVSSQGQFSSPVSLLSYAAVRYKFPLQSWRGGLSPVSFSPVFLMTSLLLVCVLFVVAAGHFVDHWLSDGRSLAAGHR